MNLLQNVADINRSINVQAVSPQVDPGNHYLLVPARSDALRLAYNVCQATACHPSAHIRDDAVGAEGAAPILNLNQRARPPARVANACTESCVFTDGIVLDMLNLQEFRFSEFIQIALKIRFLSIPENEGHSGYFLNGFAVTLGVAACNQHFGFRIPPDDPAN